MSFFGLLFGLANRQAATRESLTLAEQLQEREIFVYFDGHRHRRGDPIAIYRGLKDDPQFNLDVHPGEAEEGDLEALGIMAGAVRRVFGVKSADEGGLTEMECAELLRGYLDYTGSLKKNSSTPPMPLSPTITPTPPASLGEQVEEMADSITNSTADSSSTATGPNSDIPPG